MLLWHLADRHNADSKRCDPSPELLARDAEMSRATLDRHLGILQASGLVRPVPRLCSCTQKRISTAYELSFDRDFSVLQDTQDLCPGVCDSGGSRCDTGLASAVYVPPSYPQPVDVTQGFWDLFVTAHPRIGSRERTEAALLAALQAGVAPDTILAGARTYAVAQKGTETRDIVPSENWVERRGWENFASSAPPRDPDVRAQQFVKAIKGLSPWAAGQISPRAARALVRRGLVTKAECTAAGVSF
jgi:hypothetical protein